jgi:hypothetical protein
MCPFDPSTRLLHLERDVLRALCRPLADELRERLNSELKAYQWRSEDHRIVFRALQRVRKVSPASLREQLPARAARMGFPDIDWPSFFEVCVPGEDIENWVCDLKASARAH